MEAALGGLLLLLMLLACCSQLSSSCLAAAVQAEELIQELRVGNGLFAAVCRRGAVQARVCSCCVWRRQPSGDSAAAGIVDDVRADGVWAMAPSTRGKEDDKEEVGEAQQQLLQKPALLFHSRDINMQAGGWAHSYFALHQ